jgi:hypothetical protein
MMKQLYVAQAMSTLLKNQNIKGVLVGTGALSIRGHNVQVNDLDFLVEKAPLCGDAFEQVSKGSGPDGSLHVRIAGVHVDFIVADVMRKPFLTENPDIIHEVPVADTEHVVGLKLMADRPKDKQFFEGWKHL